MDDVRAVMDAIGCKRTALLGQADGGPIAILFAATYPERVSSLVLSGTPARVAKAPDYPEGIGEDEFEVVAASFAGDWGTGTVSAALTTDASNEETARDALAVLERSVGTPRAALRQLRLGHAMDVRSALPLVKAPTLVIYTPRSQPFPASLIRYTAEHIPGARYVELPSPSTSWDVAKQDAYIDVIEEFLTGQRPAHADVDRVLATVLFTDIVESTKHAARLGDRRWRGVLDAHDARCAAEVARFRGRIVKQTGDGLLATFDGPARAIRCAHAITDTASELGFAVRAGLHTGEVEQRGDDVSGLAVHIAARVASLAQPGEVLTSGTVRDLVVGSGMEFDDRGEHELRGVDGHWRLLGARRTLLV